MQRMMNSVLDTSKMIKKKTMKMKEQADRAFEELSRMTTENGVVNQMQSDAKIQEYQSEVQAFKEILAQRGYTEQVTIVQYPNSEVLWPSVDLASSIEKES